MSKAIILGGGFSGCVAANELSKEGWEVILFEKNSYLGGGCRTFFYGGHPYTEGPRPLSVTSDKVFSYIDDIVPLRTFHLYLNTYIEQDKEFYTYPIHWDDINKMPDKENILKELNNLSDINNTKNMEEAWIASVGKTLYNKYVNNYTKKMWKIESNTIFEDFNWTLKGVPIQKNSKFVELKKGCPLHAYPIDENGYNKFFDYCVRNSKVYLNKEISNIDLEKREINIDNEIISGDIIVSTICLDDLMKKSYGELRYMGRDFIKIVLPTKHAFGESLHFIHYPNREPFTRIVEYKNLTLHKSNSTLLVMEIPSYNNRLYCYETKDEKLKSRKYLDALPNNVYSVGRLGTYKYLNIGDCLEMVWQLVDKL